MNTIKRCHFQFILGGINLINLGYEIVLEANDGLVESVIPYFR